MNNWWPIFILNLDMKLISKALACCLKNVITTIINENQVVHVTDKFVSQGIRLPSAVLEITNSLDIEVFLVFFGDFEKAFNPINHSFLLCVLKKNCVWN